jgi:hypothetical protein
MPYRARPVPPLEKIPTPRNTKKILTSPRNQLACGRSAGQGGKMQREILTRF